MDCSVLWRLMSGDQHPRVAMTELAAGAWVLAVLTVLACAPEESPGSEIPTGGTASGGLDAGTGGAVGLGSLSSGGSGAFPTGGATAGGTSPTGGVAPSGGAPTGGAPPSTGGLPSGGGPSGGQGASGATAATGGTGALATGGGLPTGGIESTGGVPATGGQQACTWSGAPASESGELTCYWFSQGTAANFPECAEYKTYCGYCGTETGERGTSDDVCPVYDIQNQVENISTPHFAAFPLVDLQQGGLCGMCLEVSYNGATILATVVDACGSCDSGHVDLSLSAAEALGMTGWNGNPKEGVQWRAVGCPATGDIYATFNGNDPSYRSQVYFQNPAFPIVSAEAAGRTATMNNAFWDFGAHVAGETVTLTDAAGHTATGTIPTADAGGSIGAQFDLTCL